MRRIVLLGVLCGMSFSAVSAQSVADANKEYVYKQKCIPEGIDNYLFSTYYYNGKKTYNLRNLPLSSSSGEVLSLKINPSGSSFAVLERKGKETRATVHDLWKSNQTLHEFREFENLSAIAYTPDAKRLILATDTALFFFDARSCSLLDKMRVPFAATLISVSKNNFFLAIAHYSIFKGIVSI